MNDLIFKRIKISGAILTVIMIIVVMQPAKIFASENIPVVTDIKVTYIVDGNVKTAGGDRFTLTADDPQSPMPEGSTGGEKTITIRDEGSFSFGDICYERPDIYWYTITRDVAEKKGVIKDDTVYRAKVIALNDGHGYVLVYKDGSDKKHELIYTDRVAPETGDMNTLAFTAAMFALAAAAFVLTAVIRFRKK